MAEVPTWLLIIFYSAITVGSLVGTATGIAALRGWTPKWVKRVDTHMTETKTSISRLRREVKRLLLTVFGHEGGLTLEGASPLSLTKFGEEVAQELEADKWVQETVQSFRVRVRGDPPDLIEEKCFEYLVYDDEEFVATPMGKRTRLVAYEHGIAREQVSAVLVIMLRDELIRLEAEEPLDQA